MNEADARKWILDGLNVWLRGAQLTPTVIDDRAAQAAMFAVQNDVIWAWMWRLLEPVLNDRVMAEEQTVTGAIPEVEAVCDEAKLDPDTIITLLNLIFKAIEIFRQRRG